MAWRSFFEETRFFFSKAMESPGSSPFEVLIALFLTGVVAVVVVGVGWSFLRGSLVPFIKTLEFYNRLFGHVAAWIIVVLIFATAYEFIARYFLSAPTK